MSKDSKESLVIRKILEKDYYSDSLVLGNINPTLMVSVEKKLSVGIGQNIALINLLNKDMEYADSSDSKDILFEYFWGFVYRYIYFNPELKQKYVDSNLEEKILFFNYLLESGQNLNFLDEKKYLFSSEPNRVIHLREECDFRICILNYQNISSLQLAQYINLLTRERPQLTILTQEHGLKTNSTGGFYTSIGEDFTYYDVGGNGKGCFRLEKLKIK